MAREIAKAVNRLLDFSGDDQQALLDVIQDYFCEPDPQDEDEEDDNPEDSLDHEDGQAPLELLEDHTGELGGTEDELGSENDDEGELPDTEERVQEALHALHNVANDITITDLPTDNLEERFLSTFATTGCGCTKAKGKPCYLQFSLEYVNSVRASCAELSKSELDMVIFGQLIGCINDSSSVSVVSRHQESERVKSYASFLHRGKPVCCRMFLVLHGISKKRLDNLSKRLRVNGLTARVHGNVHRKPKHALSFSSTEYVVRFLLTYSEEHSLLLPGRIPGYKRSDIQLLPSSTTRRAVWRVYSSAAEAVSTIHVVAYSTFCFLWRTLVPSIVVLKPQSDLCWQCQQNSALIVRTANSSGAEKTAAISDALEHLRVVKLERSYYKSVCDECKESVRAHYVTDGKFTPPQPCSQTPHNSKDIKAHYSFDYAQQVHYPSNPLQPGPIYFLTPRKCTVFGVNCEALPRQINFLTDEAGDCGKGANAVVSRLHYFFENHGLGEKEVHLHADNCCGQNKNNCMMQYLIWRVLTSRHTSIILSFLIVGHTKFSPDWCFGLFKRRYRRTKVDSLQSIAQVVNDSADCNFAQLVAREDGSMIVQTFDWTNFFAPHLKRITAIKKYHHFRFTSLAPGCVFVKEHSDSPEIQLDLCKATWNPRADELPAVIPPKGLSVERQWYLYEQIRPFCADEFQDTVCPLPSVPKPGSRQGTPNPENEPPPLKRRRLCGICKQEGHDKRSCPERDITST